jgi:initiation factor 1A
MASKKDSSKDRSESKREFVTKDYDQEYGVITKKLGGYSFGVRLHLGQKDLIGHARGRIRSKAGKANNKLDVGTVVLVSLRDFSDKTCDILQAYTPAEARLLKQQGQLVIPDDAVQSEATVETSLEDNIDFSDI